MKIGVFCITVVLSVITIWWFWGTSQTNHELTFSNTQIFDPALEQFLNRPLGIATTTALAIVIDPPPANDSEITQQEMQYLHAHVADRTLPTVLSIRAEQSLSAYTFGSTSLAYLMSDPAYAATGVLLKESHYGFTGVIHRFKQKFDRVRPSYLDPGLTTAITVPRHASYPSGHASEAFLFAFILGALDPEYAAVYRASAEQIAQHREIAGLHYPSDSTAGEALAEQYFAALEAEDWWQERFQAAQVEW